MVVLILFDGAGFSDMMQPQRDGHPWYFTKQALKKAGTTTRPLLSEGSDTGGFKRKIDRTLHLGKAARLFRTGKSCLDEHLHKINAFRDGIPFSHACRRRVSGGLRRQSAEAGLHVHGCKILSISGSFILLFFQLHQHCD